MKQFSLAADLLKEGRRKVSSPASPSNQLREKKIIQHQQQHQQVNLMLKQHQPAEVRPSEMAPTCQQAVIHHVRENVTSKDQFDPFDLNRGPGGPPYDYIVHEGGVGVGGGSGPAVKGVLKGGEIPPLNKMYKRIDVIEVGRLARPLSPLDMPSPRVVTVVPQGTKEMNRSCYSSIPNIET